MQRRDISKALFAAAAASTVVARQVASQTCSAPCYTQTVAESAAGVTPVNYANPPGVIDRYGTNATPGATDMSGALIAAASVAAYGGPSPTFLAEKYFIDANVTVNAQCVFTSGTVITLGAGVTLGGIQNLYLQAEWFGAVGDGVTNDGPAIQVALNVCMQSNCIPLQLLLKKYYTAQTLYAGGSPTSPSAGAVPVHGLSGLIGGASGPRGTVLTDNGAFSVPGTPILMYRCLPSYDLHTEVRDIAFDSIGSSNAVGICWAGICYARAVNCKFGATSLYEGMRWYNLDVGSYTEYCIAEKCEFFAGCVTTGHFVVSQGNDSFHGSGWDARCLINVNGAGPAVVIDNGADWYNGVFDAQVFGSAFTLFQNNNSTSQLTNISASGRLTLEIGHTGTVTLGAGPTNGSWFLFTGDIRSNGANVVPGMLLRCRSFVHGNTSAPAPIGAERTSTQAMTTGANTLATHYLMAGCTRKVLLLLNAAGYEYQYELTVCPQAGSGAFITNAIGGAPSPLVAIGSYGSPTFSATANGQIIVTNANWPSSGVTAYMWEGQMSPGGYGGQFGYL